MSQDEFTKLFKHLEEFRKDVNKQLADIATKEQVNLLTDVVDAYAKKPMATLKKC